MIDQARFFDSYADRWDSMERADIGVRLARVVAEADIQPGMRLLDVGTGTGVIIPHLLDALQGDGTIIAIDISPGMLRVARSKGFPDCVQFHLMDIEAAPCPAGSYDRVICNAVFPHFTNKQTVLAHIRQMLKPGGLLVISHPTGRDAVNKVHQEAGPVVAEDRVPDADTMHAMLETARFADIRVADEPEFYLALARKPLTH